MEYPVQSQFDVHDRYQLEFKYDYELLPRRQTRYKVTTYIFVPQSLGINPLTYPQSDFYRDLKNYVRLKTPSFSLHQLLTEPDSPLVRIERMLAPQDWISQPGVEGSLITNYKFLRATLKNALDLLLSTLGAAMNQGHDSDALAATVSREMIPACNELDAILTRFRKLVPAIRVRNVDARVQRSFLLTDESISLVVEEALIEVLRLLDRNQLRADLPTLTTTLLRQVEAEQHHRRAQHYDSVLAPDRDAGEFLYRMSILKKFTSSVLFLSTSTVREGTLLEQLLFAGAAGISMIFATVIAFYFQQRYGNFTFPFFLALVVGYMFKDRIKESMRGRSARLLQNMVYDRRTVIRSHTDAQDLGYMRERMNFVAEREIPVPIAALRNRQLLAELDNDGLGEQIIRYEKVVVLKKNALNRIYADAPKIDALKDIMRFDIRSFLRKMDTPHQRWFYLDQGEIESIRLPRVYYINFIQRYELSDRRLPAVTERWRATVTRKGIRKLELIRAGFSQ